MDLNLFRAVNRNYVPEFDLDTVSNVYNTLQQRHDQAVIQESAVKKAIGDLQFNAQEDEFKQKLADRIDTVVQAEMIDGFKGYALNELIEEQGNIFSNPQVIGRLRAQQEYKTYQDNLNNRKDLSEDKKNYFREINHYYYEDKYDATGKIIGGTEWKPIKREVSEVPKSVIMNQALQWAAKETGGGTQVTFLDANGNPTSDYTQSADGNVFMYQSGSYQKLSKEKLRQAVNAAIETVAGAKASLNQDYEIALWKDKKEGSNPDVRDNNGQLLSFNEYINKGFDDAIDAASYYNFTSDIKFGDALKARREAQKASADSSNTQLNKQITDLIQSNSNLEVVQNTTSADLTATIANTKEILKNKLGTDISNKSISELRTLVSGITNPIEKYTLLNSIDELELAETNLNRFKENMSVKEQESFDFINAIDSGSSLPNNNVSTKANQFIDSLFPPEAAGIELYFNNDDEQQLFISNMNGIENIKKLGAEITNVNGQTAIYVPREAKNNIYTIGKALKNARNENSNVLFELSRNLNDIVLGRTNKFNVAIRTNDNKRIDPTWNGDRFAFMPSKPENNYGVHGDGAVILNGFVSYVDDQRINVDTALAAQSVPIQTQFIPAATVDEAEARIKLASGIGDDTLLSKQINNQQELATAALAGIDLTQHNTRVWNEDTGGVYTKLSTEDLMKYNALLTNSQIKKHIDMSFDINGEPDMIVSMVDDDNKPIRLKIGGIDNETTRAWKANTTFKAKSDIIKLINFDKDISLTNNTSFANIPKLNIDKNLILTNAENKVKKQLNQSEASELRDAYLAWTQTANAIYAGLQTTPERIESVAENTAETYAKYVYDSMNPNLIQGIKQRLLKNIGL